jgi:sulfur-carrier protein
MIRVRLPAQLRALANVDGEVLVSVVAPATLGAVLDAVEASFPALEGTIRERTTGARRPMIRLFANGEDLSDAPPDALLPEVVARGQEPLLVVGAIAGG